MSLEDKNLRELFRLSKKIGSKRYHKLTSEDFYNYLAYDRWRYINSNAECGTTDESRAWVSQNSDWYCPICSENYRDRGGKTIDHKLPRAHYPWLSLEWSNLWVICQQCNREKGEKNWYEYEQYMYERYPHDYPVIKAARPKNLLPDYQKTNESDRPA